MMQRSDKNMSFFLLSLNVSVKLTLASMLDETRSYM